MTSLEFYQNLIPITAFTDITKDSGFVDVPQDWVVILTDLRGSTKAIEEGRYKEVNLLGAAGIAVIKNTIGTRDFPFVFGGDGATCVLPSTQANLVKSPLQQLQRHALDNFSLSLRVGVVPVSAVLAHGGRIQIGRYQLAPGSTIGIFRGGGLQIAEDLVKKDSADKYLLVSQDPASISSAPPLNDLSCRWAPILNRNGTVVAVMIQARNTESASEIFRQILAEIYPIFEAEEFSPVHTKGLRLERFWLNLKRELNLRRDLGWWQKIIQVLFPVIAVNVMRLSPWRFGKSTLESYLDESMRVSDYKKLDDTLRMVLDCSVQQANEFEAVLRSHFDRGEIFYGVNRSDSALMTCIVEGLNQGEHVHFIDGADGGYALAAKQMKQQRSRVTV